MGDNQTQETEHDPGASTQMFRAFVEETEPQRPQISGRALLITAAVIVVVAVIAAIAVF
jgi:preprotein translocase subunit Sec61beta